MAQQVRMVALVDGKETEVGRCLPGQARILIKTKKAAWNSGKLLLAEPPEPVQADYEKILAILAQDGVIDVNGILGALSPRDQAKPWEREQLSRLQARALSTRFVTEIWESAWEFFRQVRWCASFKHRIVWSPLKVPGWVGFFDMTTDRYHSIETHLLEHPSVDAMEVFGFDREILRQGLEDPSHMDALFQSLVTHRQPYEERVAIAHVPFQWKGGPTLLVFQRTGRKLRLLEAAKLAMPVAPEGCTDPHFYWKIDTEAMVLGEAVRRGAKTFVTSNTANFPSLRYGQLFIEHRDPILKALPRQLEEAEALLSELRTQGNFDLGGFDLFAERDGDGGQTGRWLFREILVLMRTLFWDVVPGCPPVTEVYSKPEPEMGSIGNQQTFHETLLGSVAELFQEYQRRHRLGRATISHDDPRNRTLGFKDLWVGEYVCVPMTVTMETWPSGSVPSDFPMSQHEARKAFFQRDQRALLFTHNPWSSDGITIYTAEETASLMGDWEAFAVKEGLNLHPTLRMVLKVSWGVPLNLEEAETLKHLAYHRQCNWGEVVPGKLAKESLVKGAPEDSQALFTFRDAYETFRLANPGRFRDLPKITVTAGFTPEGSDRIELAITQQKPDGAVVFLLGPENLKISPKGVVNVTVNGGDTSKVYETVRTALEASGLREKSAGEKVADAVGLKFVPREAPELIRSVGSEETVYDDSAFNDLVRQTIESGGTITAHYDARVQEEEYFRKSFLDMAKRMLSLASMGEDTARALQEERDRLILAGENPPEDWLKALDSLIQTLKDGGDDTELLGAFYASRASGPRERMFAPWPLGIFRRAEFWTFSDLKKEVRKREDAGHHILQVDWEDQDSVGFADRTKREWLLYKSTSIKMPLGWNYCRSSDDFLKKTRVYSYELSSDITQEILQGDPETLRKRMKLSPWPRLEGPEAEHCFGAFRMLKDRVIRIVGSNAAWYWEECLWDEEKDCYILGGSNYVISPVEFGGERLLLVREGFEHCLEAAERRIAQLLAEEGGDAPEPR